jgi:sigma-B regulation protein RsbU (phosphoserine phosphatase)
MTVSEMGSGRLPDHLWILVVDDFEANLQLVQRILEREFRCRVDTAHSGKRAMELANAQNFDLILLDINLPEISGFEVCQKMRSQGRNQSTPIIFLTGRDKTEDVVQGFGVGATDYIIKPFHKEELVARVRSHLQHALLSRELAREKRERDLDFQLAATVQQRILFPAPSAGQLEDLEYHIAYLPMNGTVSGDYYNMDLRTDGMASSTSPDSREAAPGKSIFLADATGHGVHAAMTTMQIDLLLRETSHMNSPAERLAAINESILALMEKVNLFSALLIHQDGDRLVCASAGHLPQLHVGDDIKNIKATGKLLGLLSGTVYREMELAFAEGDVLVLYTDGLTEELDSQGNEYGVETIQDVAAEWKAETGSPSLEVLGQRILESLSPVESNYQDDVTLILIRRSGQNNRPAY